MQRPAGFLRHAGAHFATVHISSQSPANALNDRCSESPHGANELRKGDEEMIGCLIAGGLVVFALSRVFHARRWYHGHHGWGGCHSRHGGWHGGPWGRFGGPHGWGGPGLDDDDDWGASFRDGGGPDAWGGVRGKRYFIRSVLSRVNATPAQARAIAVAFDEFRD